MAKKTTRPTGLSISRSNKKFTFSWKIASTDHGAGQELQYKEYYNKTSRDGSITLNKTQTSTYRSINVSNYYPTNPDNRLKKVYFKVRGRRKKYKKKQSDRTYIEPDWSVWVDKSFDINEPYDPVVSQSLDADLITTFSWTGNVSNSDHRMFTDYEFQTKLVSKGAAADWSNGHVIKIHANGIDGDTGEADTGTYNDSGYSGATLSYVIDKNGGSVTITEDSNTVKLAPGNTSHTRYFRVRARGPGGPSGWATTKHIYACPRAVDDVYHDSKDIELAANAVSNAMMNYRNVLHSISMGGGGSGSSVALGRAQANMNAASAEYNNVLNQNAGAIMTVRKKNASGSVIKLAWKCDTSNGHPVDYCEIEYCIVEPVVTTATSNNIVKSTISCPPSPSWTSAGVVYDSKDWASFSFILPTYVPVDNMMFVRVNTVHDNITNYGKIFEVVNSCPGLAPPSGLTYVDLDPTTNRMEITTPLNNSAITNSFIVLYFRSKKNANATSIVGIVPWTETGGTKIITHPAIDSDDTPGLGMLTVVGNYSPANFTSVTKKFSVEEYLSSGDIVWSAGVIPMPPTLKMNAVKDHPDWAYADWDWTWGQANAAELSWSSNEKAWNSTDDPSTYTVKSIHKDNWYITGLAPGMWHFRCRLLQQTGSETSYGSYSDTISLDLAYPPIKPVVESDTYTVVAGKSFTLFWGYASEDGSEPDKPEATFCPLVNGVPTPNSKPFVRISSQKGKYDQSETFSTGKTNNHAAFPVGETTYIAVRTKSVTGKVSEWSEPIGILVVPKITASITSTSLGTATVNSYSPTDDTSIVSGKTYYVLDDDEYVAVNNPVAADLDEYYEKTTRTVSNALTTLPLQVTVAGNGTSGTTSVTITRKENYVLTRPELKTDEMPYNGFEGETIATKSKNNGAGTINIYKSDLIGTLDDGETYTITAVVTDAYGQTAKTTKDFEVRWAHQALMPTAVVTPNSEDLITTIRVPAPTGTLSGDSVDIYRLSADAPELIVQGGNFGTTYVDPYPTLGEFGGHRVVFRTKNGDFITEANQLAMADYNEDSDNIIDYFGIVIDFADEQVRLPYNVKVSNKWSKDFTEVKYLGGSIKGFWNPATSRSASLSTVVAIQEDENGHDIIRSMRRLANYAGICHVRTPEGSSFSANVNVNEDQEEKWVNRLATFSLEITRVNPEGFEGMTLSEWESGNL